MGLADSLAVEKAASKGGVRCSVCVLIRTLDADDRGVLNAALADETIASSAISRALEKEGHQVGAPSIARHRRGDCRNH